MTAARRWVSIFCLALAAVALPAMAAYDEAPHNPANPFPVYCTDCHSIHGASYPSLLDELCDYCHFDGGPAPDAKTHSSLTTDNGYGNWDVDCWTCHNPHTQEQDNAFGTTYGKYIRHTFNAREIKEIDPLDPGPYYEPISILRTVTSADIEYKGKNEFVDGDASHTDDLCQVCHVQTAFYEPGLALNYHDDFGADSQPGGDCSTCHFHTDGFGAAGSCIDCHNQAQPTPGEYRRQVTGVGGDFERTSHHVTDGTPTDIATADDCVVCHDQSSHQGNLDPSVLLNDPDGGASHTFDGNGASVEGLCAGCHDADGATAHGGLTPFTDGRTPPDIASTWTTSSHGTALTQDKCLACHGGVDATAVESVTDHGAHGSTGPKLLSDLVDGEVIANYEEGLCFACHDSDGMATADIESTYGTPRWVTDIVGPLDNLNLNDRHDVLDATQAVSGAKLECIHCHDTHAATAGNPLRADPDPDDGHVPGDGNTLAGADFMTEWCLDCHDGSLPSTVTPPTVALTNIQDAFQEDDAHGLQGGNATLKSGYGWGAGDLVPCAACHRTHHTSAKTNLFQLVDVVLSKDGTTSIPSDNVGLNYDVTDNIVKVPAVNGYEWCNTCHTNSMGDKKDNCFVCHYHSTRF